MNLEKYNRLDVEMKLASFSAGAVNEYHLVLKPIKLATFNIQLEQVLNALSAFTCEKQIFGNSVVFMRLFVSDYANQIDVEKSINNHGCSKEVNLCLSVVQQPPLSNNKVEALVHIIEDKKDQQSITKTDKELTLARGNYTHIWSTQMITENGSVQSDKQTENIFKTFNNNLVSKGLTLKENCIRTWLFVKDVDFNYKGVVDARKAFFESVGMASGTNYISSTGIEGRFYKSDINVLMDAYSVGGISKEQVKFLTAPEKLSPTIDYGVTFERGTAVDYGDRRHIFISGTASINNKGEVVHVNDVEKQAARAIENIEALLNDAQAKLQDIAHLIVYLRDIADYPVIRDFFDNNLNRVPKVIVLAPVCRPEWLVELECMAIKKTENKQFTNF